MSAAAAGAAKRRRLGGSGIVPVGTEGVSFKEYQAKRRSLAQADKSAQTYRFAQSRYLRDHKGRRPKDEDYDCRRITVPETSLAQMPERERAYWTIKRNYFDTLLCFQQPGGHWLLHERDAKVADQAVQPYGTQTQYFATARVEDARFELFAARMVKEGRSVGRLFCTAVSSSAPPAPASSTSVTVSRGSRGTSRDGQLMWKLERVDSPATFRELVDGIPSSWMVAIKEDMRGCAFGVAAVDCARGQIRLAATSDAGDVRGILHRLRPAEILLERHHCERTRRLCAEEAPGVAPRLLVAGREFRRPTEAREALLKRWADADKVELAAWWDDDLVVSALGAAEWQLEYCNAAEDVFAMRSVAPADAATEWGGDSQQALSLDAAALRGLCVLRGECGEEGGGLLQWFPQCATAFGQRLLGGWLAAPLRTADAIRARQDAVAELASNADRANDVRYRLRKLPDLERRLARLAAATARGVDSPEDAEERDAVCEDLPPGVSGLLRTYASAVSALGAAAELVRDEEGQWRSAVLCRVLARRTRGGCFPEYDGAIEQCRDALDLDCAAEGDAVPRPGTDAEFDELNTSRIAAERAVRRLLDEVRLHYGLRDVRQVGVGQGAAITVPAAPGRAAPLGWECTEPDQPPDAARGRQAAGILFLRSPRFASACAHLEEVAVLHAAAVRRCIVAGLRLFASRAEQWREAVRCLSEVDALCSLAEVAARPGMCRPEVLPRPEGQAPLLDLRGVFHPLCRPPARRVSAPRQPDWAPVPSDVFLGHPSPCMLLTGPNMGGKSTLMRAVAAAVLLAQVGSWVPAQSARLTPADRIFCRMGAGDEILVGRSTFFNEMEETAAVLLRGCSEDSLVLLDELGRGTSTADGEAIAHAVLRALAEQKRCRCLFSTHYNSLSREAQAAAAVQVCHMAFAVHQNELVFHYSLAPGPPAQRYGVRLAREAGIPDAVCAVAEEKARQLELQDHLARAAAALRRLRGTAH
eukprot:TRINITY_DN60626_c0_g1_i1.p1 TRINITY_DN60626_c0_g1~~TRINITY_DN60626_c0_g1_i1.p1  ORF type:complete len:1016 (+),score=304.06 TRINITY_DN60626_c0_g1_i1:96-3050(+)